MPQTRRAPSPTAELVTFQATLQTILPLRHRVLLPGFDESAARFEGDSDPTTLHFVTMQSASADVGPFAVCCATLTLGRWEDRPARQLRGMATDPAFQGHGLGSALLAFAEQVTGTVPYTWWCNARTSAIPFYEKLGWEIVSNEFDIPTAGPHRKMLKQLT